MNTQHLVPANPAMSEPSSFTPVCGNLLQRKCACGGTPGPSGECEVCQRKRSSLQRKSSQSELGTTVTSSVPSIVHEVLRSPGAPLDAATLAFMEPRFGHDFSRIRVHTGAAAAQAAREINARAFTIGNDIVLAEGRFSTDADTGKSLLAHELTHTIQQRGAAPAKLSELKISEPEETSEREADLAADAVLRDESPRPRYSQNAKIARQVATTSPPVAPPLGKSFAELWSEFEQHRMNFRMREALGLAPTLAWSMSGSNAMNHGLELAEWAGHHGDWKTASQALHALESAWWIEFVSIHNGVPLNFGSLGTNPQTRLISWAKSEADAGSHDRARQLFGLAFILTQMVLQDQTARHLASLTSMGQPDMDFTIIRLINYSNEQTLIAMLREILSFYPNLERQALAAGQTEEAGHFAKLDQQLRTELHDRYTLLGGGEGSAALTLEASSAETRGLQGYRLHGVRGEEEIVTPLPGTPLPDELGRHPAYTISMDDLVDTLQGQEDFITGLMQHQEFRAAFGTRRPDLNQLHERLRIWQVMFRVFRQQPVNGCTTALCSLLRLLQQYLRNFTTHTEYNIRDFGQTYLTTQFPEDLIGRTMRDCGVYAVTVAYEVFRTVRNSTPRMPVGFQLYHTLEHSMLAIFDLDSHTHYVVNNDQITGPNSGDTDDAVAGSIAGSYAETMGTRMAASIGGRSERLTTDLSDARFRSRIWQNYQVGATLALHTEPPIGPDDKRTEAERRDDTYRHYYERMARLGEAGVRAHAQLDELNRRLLNRPQAEHAGIIEQSLASLSDAGLMMALFFGTYLLNPRASGLAVDRTTVSVEAVGLFTTGSGQTRHPLVRIARLLIYYQGLGQTLTPSQQVLVNDLMSARTIPSFFNDLTDYQAAHRPASF